MNDREYIYDKLIDHEVERRQLIKQRDEWYEQPISQLTVKNVLALQQLDRAIERLDEYIKFDREYLGIDDRYAELIDNEIKRRNYIEQRMIVERCSANPKGLLAMNILDDKINKLNILIELAKLQLNIEPDVVKEATKIANSSQRNE